MYLRLMLMSLIEVIRKLCVHFPAACFPLSLFIVHYTSFSSLSGHRRCLLFRLSAYYVKCVTSHCVTLQHSYKYFLFISVMLLIGLRDQSEVDAQFHYPLEQNLSPSFKNGCGYCRTDCILLLHANYILGRLPKMWICWSGPSLWVFSSVAV